MTTTTRYAAIDTDRTGAIWGLGSTPDAAIDEALRACPPTTDVDGVTLGGRDSYLAVPITEAAARHVETHGGAPSHLVTVSRVGVSLRSEEE